MKKYPNCGFHDGIYWRSSRYDFNADYCRREEFPEMEPELSEALGENEPLIDGDMVYYRRGTGKVWVYRVAIEDFKVSTEKRRAWTKPKIDSTQKKLEVSV